ncbi:hypothetical protein TTHERM_00685880 (macronuclear) [Tetrahymena thermophila SB210]|uniref:Transmembrane protein n=1 Tax=Tetrahymena thermophila (strain SB210) TaxID=312017 RepID=I7MJ12_TETTS|nr:hypothetical protein TTHERM_00685880 [Tetrahymena thermophila SB210]EAS04945.1 hypothetical protein TTHERM_00685880 [Tetrahymena thermophila SB210]|eukprot:XP_001025190.1 hypothetical protein TTHERM_00685880 [Tetrahymena thermophila SB210]
MKLIVILFAIFTLTANAINQDPQCIIELKNKQVCEKDNSYCYLELSTFNKCTQQCANQNSQDQYANTICTIQKCKPSNISVKNYYYDVVECLKSSTTYDPLSPQINSESCLSYLFDMQNSQKICKEGDTDCIAEAKSLKICAQFCSSYDNQDKKVFCIKKNCSPKNQTVQLYLNDLTQCVKKNSQDIKKSTNSSKIVLEVTIFFFLSSHQYDFFSQLKQNDNFFKILIIYLYVC